MRSAPVVTARLLAAALLASATLACGGGGLDASPALAREVDVPVDLRRARLSIFYVPVSRCAPTLAPIVTTLRRSQAAFPGAAVYTALPREVRMDPAFVVGEVVPRSTRGRAAIAKQHAATLIVYDREGRLLLWRVVNESRLEADRLFAEIRAAYSLTSPSSTSPGALS